MNTKLCKSCLEKKQGELLSINETSINSADDNLQLYLSRQFIQNTNSEYNLV